MQRLLSEGVRKHFTRWESSAPAARRDGGRDCAAKQSRVDQRPRWSQVSQARKSGRRLGGKAPVNTPKARALMGLLLEKVSLTGGRAGDADPPHSVPNRASFVFPRKKKTVTEQWRVHGNASHFVMEIKKRGIGRIMEVSFLFSAS